MTTKFKSKRENIVWTIEITNVDDDTYCFYADGKLVARQHNCEDSQEAIVEFGKRIFTGDIDMSEEIE